MSSSVPAPLQPLLEQALQPLLQAGLVPRASLRPLWSRVLLGSEYLREQCLRRSGLFAWLEEQAAIAVLERSELEFELQQLLANVNSIEAMQPLVRSFRHRYLCRVIWRDVAGLSELNETLGELSLLADTLLSVCQQRLFEVFCERHGTPKDQQGKPQPLAVFAMGKLGAKELNLSSDIDLIFAYGQEGELAQISYQQFYTRLGQALIRVLDHPTVDGFAYRVDMRLRPWGNAGALASSFNSLVRYYQEQGREWERYALIKIRAVAGDIKGGKRFIQRLKPFVFRRYLDYGAFKSLREMKLLIEREVRQQGLFDDIKLGAGGIREIEFIVQVHQLVHGGQQESLQQPHLLLALPRLAEYQLLAPQDVAALQQAYVFLRRMEHRLQAYRDEQTQQLPQDDTAKLRLAYAMGYSSVAACEMALINHRARVRYQFQALIALPEDEREVEASVDQQAVALWRGQLPKQRAVQLLQDLGVRQSESVTLALVEFRQDLPGNWQQYGDSLDRILPRLLEALGYHQGGANTLERLLHLLGSLVEREPHHLELLAENPKVIHQMVKLCSLSSAIASLITQYPALLEELLHAFLLYRFPTLEELQDELRQQLLRVPAEDVERQLQVIRHFKQVHQLRVMVQESTEQLSLMKVSHYLSWIAQTVVQQVLQLAWQQQVAQHGAPCDATGNATAMQCLVVAYGKLGSLEMSYDSDLDVVFLYEAEADASTEGEHSLPNPQFYNRVSQQFLQYLASGAAAEALYDVDTRLRPTGAMSALAHSISAFEHYQARQAWVWEHQALVRARGIAGDGELKQRFDRIRDSILRLPRHESDLIQAVVEMRKKLLRQHPPRNTFQTPEELKLIRGGIVDIEFMVQYGVLRWANNHVGLIGFTDNLKLLDTLATNTLVPAHEAGLLREAYLAYRSAVHRGALGKKISALEATYLTQLCQEVSVVWQRWFEHNPAA